MLEKFTLAQKISLAVLMAGILITFILVMSWASRPKYGVLFSGLIPKDAGSIVEELKSSKVPYKIDTGGATILVPEVQVYELRMKFASMGMPVEGVVGYELFDKTKLGMTDFIQKLNYHRALEGELSRTLTSINEILQARVHIVIPKPALFEEDKKPTTASIALRIKGDGGLSRAQVRGIANLVASSVEGLTPENITIVDSRGNILSGDITKDKEIALSASQHELQRQVEKYLEGKAQSMMVGALGQNRSLIRVSAELNFNRINKTSQTFNPESPVVRSEEVSTRISTSASQSPQTATSNSQDDEEATITNYEISNTVESVINSIGNITRLSIAVLVDGTYETTTNEESEEVREYIERPKEELAKLSAIVKNAIGFNVSRGDQISISSFPFDTSRDEEMTAEFAEAARYEFWRDIIQKGTLAVIILAMLLTVRALIRRSKRLSEILAPSPVIPEGVLEISPEERAEDEAERMRAKVRAEMGKLERAVSLDAVQKEEMISKISEFIRNKPMEASQLVKTWIYEEVS